MIAEPTSMSEFWTRLVTPSVTSWSSASTSFVSREMIAPGAVALEVAEREPLQVAEELLAQVGEDPLADPAREVRLRHARAPVEDADDEERDHDPGERGQVVRPTMPWSIATLAR